MCDQAFTLERDQQLTHGTDRHAERTGDGLGVVLAHVFEALQYSTASRCERLETHGRARLLDRRELAFDNRAARPARASGTARRAAGGRAAYGRINWLSPNSCHR
jgi:hypothetical protein